MGDAAPANGAIGMQRPSPDAVSVVITRVAENKQSEGETMSIYKKPAAKVHRGFVYLDDETVINSLSAVEAGKIDEVVAKVNSAREGGWGGGVGIQGAKIDGAKKSQSGFEEEMVRTRTRFSVFEIWYQNLTENKAIGSFEGWGAEALEGVKSGDTVEFRAWCEPAPLQTLLRLYLWFAGKAKSQGHFFSQKGQELAATKEGERNIQVLLEGNADEVIFIARPLGEAGPTVAMAIQTHWLIGNLGRVGGEYTVIAQVDRIIEEGDEFPAIRLTQDVGPTPMEVELMKDALGHFVEPAKELGVTISDNEATIPGPALWLEPIAIFR